MLIVRLLQRVEAALGYEAKGPLARADARLKLAAATLSIACLTLCRHGLPLASCLAYPLLLHAASPEAGRRSLAASAPAVLGVLALFLIVNPYRPPSLDWLAYATVMAVRVYGIASTVLITMATTRPEALASTLARIPLLHDTVVVFLRQAPLAVQDMYTAYAVQRLLGKPARGALAGTLLQSLHRASMLEAALTLRAAGHRGPRTPIAGPGDPGLGLALLAASAAPMIVSALLCLHPS